MLWHAVISCEVQEDVVVVLQNSTAFPGIWLLDHGYLGNKQQLCMVSYK